MSMRRARALQGRASTFRPPSPAPYGRDVQKPQWTTVLRSSVRQTSSICEFTMGLGLARGDAVPACVMEPFSSTKIGNRLVCDMIKI